MPGVLASLQPEDDDLVAQARSPVNDWTGMGAAADFGGLTRRVLGSIQAFGRDNPGNLGGAGGEAGAPDLTGLEPATANPKLTPDQANARFGIDGHLSFSKDVGEGEAAYKHNETQRRVWQSDVLSRSDLNPLQSIGAGVAGGLVDPLGLPLMFAPELAGLRGAVEGGLAARSARAAIEGGEAVVKAGRLANAGRGALASGIEGVAGTGLYELPNYGARRYAGEDDYTLGDSLANVLLGGGLGLVLGGLGGALHGEGPRLPRPVEQARPDSRLGAVVSALDDLTEDRPVSVGGQLEAEQARARPSADRLATLDEAPDGATLPGKYLDEAVAVTTRGTEIPVRYAIVELSDLVTSHTDDPERNPAFPAELQPRSRERAGAQARNYQLESELNPKRLMRESGAESGAPIVAGDGVVESGNGRTIAIRRSAASNGEAYAKYRQELIGQGFDLEGFDKPALVRVRTEPMTGEARANLAREMNADVTERLGATEQAMADAEGLDDASLEILGGDDANGRRDFARRFIGRVAPDQANTLVGPDGRLSAAGEGRIRAALVARAYGDPRLVEAVFETADPNIKTIGAALTEAAPGWARMRAMAARGEIPAELDLTDALRSAVDLVRFARDNGRAPAEVIAERLGQTEMFGGEAISPETEAFLRLFFRDEAFKRQRGGDSIAFALKDYARQASEVTPGPSLFGDTADASTGRDILANLARRFAGEGEPVDAPVLDLRGPGPEVERPPPIDLRSKGERAADASGPGPQPAGPEGQAGGVEPARTAAEAPARFSDPEPFQPIEHGERRFFLGRNNITDLGDYTPTLWREMSLDKLELFTPGGRSMNLAHTTGDLFFADQPELALGQGDNKGVVLEFDAHGIKGKVMTDKPTGELGFTNGVGAEYGARYNNASIFKERLRAFRINEGATAEPAIRHRIRRLLAEMEARGWTKTKGEGFVEYRRPQAGEPEKATPETAPGVSEAAAGAKPDPIAADPALKAIADDTEAFAAQHGLELAAPAPNADPATIAEAIRAGAICLATELEL